MDIQIVQGITYTRGSSLQAGGECEDCQEEMEQEQALEEENAVSGSEEDEESSFGPAVSVDIELTEEEQRVVEELKNRDREVRAHEQAHAAAAGPYARGGPQYEFTTGPDGKRYAIGGEVAIDTEPVPGDPQATIRKAQTIKRAALAPAEPSPQDRQVAAQAAKIEAEARREIAEEQSENLREGRGIASADASSSPESSESAPESEAVAPGQSTEDDTGSESSPDSSSPGNREGGNPQSPTFSGGSRNPFGETPPPRGQLLDLIA